MKLHFIILCTAILSTPHFFAQNNNTPLMIESNFDLSPDQFANYVYRRYYFINRLKSTMSLFEHIHQKHATVPHHRIHIDDHIFFHHHRIQKIRYRYTKTKKFTPFIHGVE